MWGVAEERPLSVATGCVAARGLQHNPRPANFSGLGSEGNVHYTTRLYSPGEYTATTHSIAVQGIFDTS